MDLISKKKVHPSGPVGADLLFVGEAPGYEEDNSGVPFSGDAGDRFNTLLGNIGISREKVRVTNVCNYRPKNNKFDVLKGSRELEEGLSELRGYIREFPPKFVVLLGAKPLEYIGKKYGIENWRGSVIELDGQQYFCSLHPSATLHNPANFPIISFDFQRLERYLRDGYVKPTHEFTIDPSGMELDECLREIESHETITVDLEGVKRSTYILCCGFGLTNSRAICLFNHGAGDLSFWSALTRILENPKIEKIFQNGFGYDVEVLRLNGINVQNYSFDTMIAAHVLEPEMPYGLGFLTSIYTDEPYYKDKGKSAIPDDEEKGWNEGMDREILGDYNCCDVITDYQIAVKQKLELQERGLWRKYNYQHSLIPLSLALTRSGLYIDEERKQVIKAIVKGKWKYYQELLNAIAGFKVNVRSAGRNGDVGKLLLDKFQLPERRNHKTKAITLDEDAIVSYIAFCQDKINSLKSESKREEWELKLAGCKCILLIRGHRVTISNYLNIKSAADGRLHSVYNIPAATETNRGSSHGYIDGTGNNAQTWPREILEIDEEEYSRIMEKLR